MPVKRYDSRAQLKIILNSSHTPHARTSREKEIINVNVLNLLRETQYRTVAYSVGIRGIGYIPLNYYIPSSVVLPDLELVGRDT